MPGVFIGGLHVSWCEARTLFGVGLKGKPPRKRHLESSPILTHTHTPGFSPHGNPGSAMCNPSQGSIGTDPGEGL